MTSRSTPRRVPALALALLLSFSAVTAVPWMGPLQTGAVAASSDGGSPDLLVHGLRITPEHPAPGDMVRIDVNLTNQGDAETGNFSYHVSLDDGQELNGTFDHRSIHPNETYLVTTWWNASAGNHTLTVTGDVYDEVNESEEANNVDSLRFTVEGSHLADLTINSVSVTGTHVEGEELVFSAEVENVGGDHAPESWATFTTDDGFHDVVRVPALDPQESVVVQADPYTAQAGERVLEVVADRYDNVTEGDETNNRYEVRFHVDSPNATGPDLVISELTTEPRQPHGGELFAVYVEVANIGDLSSDGTWVNVSLDGRHVGTVHVPPLAAGERDWAYAGSASAAEGNHTLSAVVDPGDVVDEADETNNAVKEPLLVGQAPLPDLVAHLSVPDGRYAGDDLTIAHGISNDGGSSGPFDYALYIDGELVQQSRSEGLPGGLGWMAGMPWDGAAGEHTARLVVDTGDEVNESDETNNEVVRTFELLSPPDPAITELTVEKTQLRTDAAEGPTNPAGGQTIKATVANLGQGPSHWLGIEVEVCGEDPMVPLFVGGRCTWEFFELGPLEPGQERTLELDWETWDKAGDYQVCARLVEVHTPQVTRSNDERCTDTFVWAGGTGLGGL